MLWILQNVGHMKEKLEKETEDRFVRWKENQENIKLEAKKRSGSRREWSRVVSAERAVREGKGSIYWVEIYYVLVTLTGFNGGMGVIFQEVKESME